MQEIKKSRIVIASVLKPVDDTRMFEKIGSSLAADGHDIHIIGYPSVRTYENSDITLHSLKNFRRISFARIFSNWSVTRKVIRLKPALLIITTHELLFTAMIASLITDCKIIYDIQENYFRNIFYTRTYPFGIRHLLAGYVRLKEYFFSIFFHHFLLAEEGYARELNYLSGRYTVIANKLRKPDIIVQAKKNQGTIGLLFSGTLAETTGVFIAIDLAEKLHQIEPAVRLHIIGYSAMDETLRTMLSRIRNKSFISLTGGDTLVPHHEIMAAIQNADFGIIAYPPNSSTEKSIPTKLYEYLGMRLPVILTDHKPWVNLCKASNSAVVFDPAKIQAENILQDMRSRSFYTNPPDNVYWENEEIKLKTLISTLV